MLRRTLKLAWFKRNRYLLTVVAIALSVAFIVSTLLLTTSIADVGEPLNDAYAEVDVAVTGPEIVAAEGPGFAITAPVAPTVVADLNAAGYEAVGFSSPYAQVLDPSGDPAGQAQASANVAEPWLGDSALNGFEITEGTAPGGPGEAAVDAATASAANLEVGSTLSYVTDAGLQQAELVGIASFGGGDNDPYTSTLLLDPSDPVFTPTRGYDYVLVAGGANTATVDDVAAIATDAEVTTGAAWVTDQVELLDSFLGFFSTFLTVFAVIAVVVGMVIVTNTFTVSLAQRTQELALLRLVGTTRRQLMSQVVLEAVFLGVAGTALGVVIGLLGNNALGWFLDLLGLTIERSSAISPTAIAIGVFVGLVVTVAAAVWPAWKATAVAPIEALRSAELESPSTGRKRSIAAAVMLVAAIGCGIYGAVQTDIWLTGIGIGAGFLALYLGADSLIRFVAWAARPLLGQAGPTGTVASRNLERNAGRTSAAASALMIGISLIAFFTLMAATIGQFIAGDAGEAVQADYVVQGIGSQPEPAINDDTLDALAAVDGVDVIAPIYSTSLSTGDGFVVEQNRPGGDSLGTAATDIDAMAEAYAFDLNAGSLDDVGGTAVIIDQATADAGGLTVGDTLPVSTTAGPLDLEVAAVVETSLPGTPQPAVIGDLDLAAAIGYDDPATTVYLVGDASEEALTEAVGLPTIDVLTTADYIDGLSSNLDTILALVYALLAVAVIIALVGIANTVSLAISERVGEIAAIRAAGASKRQIFWSLIAEFGLLALVGVLSGLALAWVSATGFFQALSGGQITYPETDVVTGLLIVVAGLAGGVLASWWPARGAAGADILDVLRAD
ncbi:MAG: FtsX-like permease family protein [Actinomycetota bacterium]